MGDNSESGTPDTVEAQIAALKSSSTNIRLDSLRKLLHIIQSDGTTNPSQLMTTF